MKRRPNARCLRARDAGSGFDVLDFGERKHERKCGIVTFEVVDVPSKKVRERLLHARMMLLLTNGEDTLLDTNEQSLPDSPRWRVHHCIIITPSKRFRTSFLRWNK